MIPRPLNLVGQLGAMLAISAVVHVPAPALSQQSGLQSDGHLVVSSAANAAIQRYVKEVSGRFGALAVSQDGGAAVSYLCRSRLWKNCDEPGADDSNLAIPSGKLARDQALTRCRSKSGAACILLFINDDQQRQFEVQP
ncbi:MAG TPA: hypothetical protein VFE34_02750 [Dongiaceae bacterium]|jgi:hypothetical protein|nr:hypothetical protein [Dongiaceae bacterium]